MYYIDDSDGTIRKLELEEYVLLHQDMDVKIVAKDTVGNSRVSTVWLGLDHSWEAGPPLIYETMIFANDGNMHDYFCERYPTRGRALQRHTEIVAGLTAWESDEITEAELNEVLYGGAE